MSKDGKDGKDGKEGKKGGFAEFLRERLESVLSNYLKGFSLKELKVYNHIITEYLIQFKGWRLTVRKS